MLCLFVGAETRYDLPVRANDLALGALEMAAVGALKLANLQFMLLDLRSTIITSAITVLRTPYTAATNIVMPGVELFTLGDRCWSK